MRAVLAPLGLAHPAAQLDYLRYSWTVSNEKITRELQFTPAHSSAEAIRDFRFADAPPPQHIQVLARRKYDDFGLDEKYFAWMDWTRARFLERYYWRVETKDLENVPREGPALLVGIHRGFMPFDGFITVHQIARQTGRIPRFLIHPGLVKFPFLHDFMTKQGGVIACSENADHVLGRGDLLAIYPEGIHGAFRMYRDVYRLGSFGRDEYIRMALRNRAPIIPFVTIGSAEIYPIVGKVQWSWWKRYSEWPFIPITSPVPLPAKWHTRFLAPLHVEQRYPPEAADDTRIVRALGREIRTQMEQTMIAMRARRRSIFWGSIFTDEPMAAAALAASPQEVGVPVGSR
jgi:1-acyl-sn-glycerol-3-phosphate acyltransferase